MAGRLVPFLAVSERTRGRGWDTHSVGHWLVTPPLQAGPFGRIALRCDVLPLLRDPSACLCFSLLLCPGPCSSRLGRAGRSLLVRARAPVDEHSRATHPWVSPRVSRRGFSCRLAWGLAWGLAGPPLRLAGSRWLPELAWVSRVLSGSRVGGLVGDLAGVAQGSHGGSWGGLVGARAVQGARNCQNHTTEASVLCIGGLIRAAMRPSAHPRRGHRHREASEQRRGRPLWRPPPSAAAARARIALCGQVAGASVAPVCPEPFACPTPAPAYGASPPLHPRAGVPRGVASEHVASADVVELARHLSEVFAPPSHGAISAFNWHASEGLRALLLVEPMHGLARASCPKSAIESTALSTCAVTHGIAAGHGDSGCVWGCAGAPDALQHFLGCGARRCCQCCRCCRWPLSDWVSPSKTLKTEALASWPFWRSMPLSVRLGRILAARVLECGKPSAKRPESFRCGGDGRRWVVDARCGDRTCAHMYLSHASVEATPPHRHSPRNCPGGASLPPQVSRRDRR